MSLHRILFALLLPLLTLSAQTRYDPNVLPKGHEYFDLRDGIAVDDIGAQSRWSAHSS